MSRKRGNGVSGGGLAARRKVWDETPTIGGTRGGRTKMVRTSADTTLALHRPGSQNPRKGGLSRTERHARLSH